MPGTSTAVVITPAMSQPASERALVAGVGRLATVVSRRVVLGDARVLDDVSVALLLLLLLLL